MKEQLARSLPDDFYLRKHWVSTAKVCLDDSLSTVPHEINELDWKLNLSEKKERLAEHLMASAFRRYHICEERGTGFQKVVTAVELFGMPPIAFASLENAFRVTLYAPRSFSDMSQAERIEACYQHAVLQFISNQSLTNTSLRERFKLHVRQRTQIANLIRDAIAAKRIRRKNVAAGKKFAEYLPYWT